MLSAAATGSFLRTHGDTKNHFSRILWYLQNLPLAASFERMAIKKELPFTGVLIS